MGVNSDTGEYEQDTADDKLDALQAQAREQFDFEPEEHSEAALTQFFATYAAVATQNQEQSLADVFDASFIDSAEGANLEAVVERIGVTRRPPTTATGVQRFESEEPVTTDHTIPSGTSIRTTDGTATFETDTDATLRVLDDMEGGDPLADYVEDTGAYSAETDIVYRGSQALRGMGGTSGQIFNENITVRRGDTITCRVYLVSGGAGPDWAGLSYFVSGTNVLGGDEAIIRPDQDIFGFRNDPVDDSVTIPKDEWLLVEVTPHLDETRTATLYNEAGDELSSVTDDESGSSNILWSGGIGLNSNNGEVIYDDLSMKAVATDITATGGGSHANVASGTLSVLNTTLSGVDATENPIPTGNSNYRDTSETVLVAGQEREDDDELRNRATRDEEGSLGNATAESILDAVSDVPSVTSLSVESNHDDSTDGDGRPSGSFEVIVPEDANYPEVARAIYETKATTDNASGGHVGTEVTEIVESNVVPSYSETISFTQAPTMAIDMDLSIVVDDNYSGDDALRRRVVDYVGGIRPDNANAVGLGMGEAVYVDELKERIMDDEGIVGFDDANTTFTPSTTTDSNGLTIIDVPDAEIAETNGSDGSISVSTTTV